LVVYVVRGAGPAAHVSEPHAPGTRELVVVLQGSLKMSVGEETYLLAVGDSLVFAADQDHVYENPGAAEARYHNVIVYRR
jgi:quercetin dioxygenase-like cupin family protein